MISLQSGAALAKQIFPSVGAEGTSALRLAFAALILCGFWRPWRHSLSKKSLFLIAAYGLSLGAMNLCFYLAIERIPLGIAVALEFCGPLGVAVIASRSLRDFFWAILAAVGIVLILPITNLSQPLDPLGLIFIFLAALFWALYIVFGHKVSSVTSGGVATSIGMAAGALLVIPFGVAKAGSALFDLSLLPVALGVAIFSSALPYSLEMSALRKLSKKQFGVLMSLEPMIAALSGFVFLSESLSTSQLIAIGFIVTASLGTALTSDAIKGDTLQTPPAA